MSLFDDLEQSVGLNTPNLPADVRKVKVWLEQAEDRAARTYQQDKQAVSRRLHEVERHMEQALADAIKEFQRRVMGDPAPSGKVHPGDKTARKLKHPHGERTKKPTSPVASPPAGTPLTLPKRRGFEPLSDDDYAKAAKDIGCEPEVIRALAKQEGKGHGFDSRNRPVLMWEPVKFAVLSHHRKQYQVAYPDLTHLKPKPHQYGPESMQYVWLERAYLINPQAALMAPSWGQFQIRGEYFILAGYTSALTFVQAMCLSEQIQLDAFVSFIVSKHMKSAMQNKDWAAISNGYNGGGSAKRVIKTRHGDTTYAAQLESYYHELKGTP